MLVPRSAAGTNGPLGANAAQNAAKAKREGKEIACRLIQFVSEHLSKKWFATTYVRSKVISFLIFVFLRTAISNIFHIFIQRCVQTKLTYLMGVQTVYYGAYFFQVLWLEDVIRRVVLKNTTQVFFFF